jgi:hypothetical protein
LCTLVYKLVWEKVKNYCVSFRLLGSSRRPDDFAATNVSMLQPCQREQTQAAVGSVSLFTEGWFVGEEQQQELGIFDGL